MTINEHSETEWEPLNGTATPGCQIKVDGETVTISQILYQHYDADDKTWDIEFIDTDNLCRRWKQELDGGTIQCRRTE